MAEAAEQKSKGGCLKVAGIIAAVLVVIIVIGALIGGQDTTPDQGSKAATPANADTPPLEVSARELFAAYDENEVSAQQKYGNRPLLISGTVDSITLDFADNPVVSLKTANQFMSAQASMKDDAEAASALKKGQNVRLLCGGVTEAVGIPMLDDCELK